MAAYDVSPSSSLAVCIYLGIPKTQEGRLPVHVAVARQATAQTVAVLLQAYPAAVSVAAKVRERWFVSFLACLACMHASMRLGFRP